MFTLHSLGTCHRTGNDLYGIRFKDDSVTATDNKIDAYETLNTLNNCTTPIIGEFLNDGDRLTLHIYTYHPMVNPYYYFNDLSVGFYLDSNVNKETLLNRAITTYNRKHKANILGSILYLPWKA